MCKFCKNAFNYSVVVTSKRIVKVPFSNLQFIRVFVHNITKSQYLKILSQKSENLLLVWNRHSHEISYPVFV